MLVRVNGRESNRRPKVGLALSGGGLRGIAHIGVLNVLLQNQIPIHMIAGTSAGAIIAAMYACGYSPRDMATIAETIKIRDLVDLKFTIADLIKHGVKCFLGPKYRFWSVLPKGLVKGDKIEKFFVKYWQQKTVRDTKIPIAITAVDINSADTVFFTTPLPGQRKILNARYIHNALLSEAVRASISIPGVFCPKKYHGMTLVDGGVKNNLPTDILHHMGADVIIAVNLGYDGQQINDIETIGEILIQCIEIMGREVTLLKGEQYADVIIRPSVYDLDFKSSRYVAHCIAKGEEAARQKLSDIKVLL
ncbi:patatin-like phospholipase family protein [Sporolituus thermophilus]|uniref:NTE family protein n=1 Tax=Sporolituus thermophilus DSM 23256 TaxID=1123285 RepID=A0A1G7M653_9FIRM|nr:patatin-like phospholipase family protein [Sporolituus thermophilus]SDF57222.1 NTE family protein [Sporolituus thermophilus DSM 23256]